MACHSRAVTICIVNLRDSFEVIRVVTSPSSTPKLRWQYGAWEWPIGHSHIQLLPSFLPGTKICTFLELQKAWVDAGPSLTSVLPSGPSSAVHSVSRHMQLVLGYSNQVNCWGKSHQTSFPCRVTKKTKYSKKCYYYKMGVC